MPAVLTLDDAYNQIMAAAASRLTAATAAGETLADVEAVVTGDRERIKPRPPYLWLVCEDLDPQHDRALHELWNATLAVSGWLTSDDPDQGYTDVTGLVMRARSVLLADRTIGLSFVDDVTSGRVFPAGPDLNKGTSFVSIAQVNVRFAILEP